MSPEIVQLLLKMPKSDTRALYPQVIHGTDCASPVDTALRFERRRALIPVSPYVFPPQELPTVGAVCQVEGVEYLVTQVERAGRDLVLTGWVQCD